MADYTEYYAGGWVDGSGGGTPISAAALNGMEAGIEGSLQKSGGTMTGDLLIPDGSAADPSLAFAGDEDTGFFRSATNQVNVAAAGAMVAWFASAGLGHTQTTGAAYIAAGASSAAAPGHTFYNDPNTGMYRVSADFLGFAAAGSRVLNASQAARIGYSSSSGATTKVVETRSQVGGSDVLHHYVEGDGDVYNTNGTYGTISDEALKTERKPARSYWDDFAAVPIESYRNKRTKQRNLNPTAQNVRAIFPSLVGGAGTSDDPLAFKQSILYGPIMATVVQELQRRVEALEAA